MICDEHGDMPGTRTLDLDLLRCFVTIAETGSFTRAGDRLGRTQSTISLQVKRLEDQIGRAVFSRTPRSLSLTPEGERLLGPARQLLRLNDAAIAELFEPDMTVALDGATAFQLGSRLQHDTEGLV